MGKDTDNAQSVAARQQVFDETLSEWTDILGNSNGNMPVALHVETTASTYAPITGTSGTGFVGADVVVKKTVMVPDIGSNYTSVTITTAVSELVSSALVGRVMIRIQNPGNIDIKLSDTSGVGIEDCYLLGAFNEKEFVLGENQNIFARTSGTSQVIQIVEFA